MNTSKGLALSLSSLLLLTAACSGSAPSVDGNAPVPSAVSSAPPAPPPAPPSPNADAGAPAPAADGGSTPVADAGAPDANVDTPMAKHCNVTPIEPDVCIENGQGHPGDIVDIDIVLLGTANCSQAGEANGHIAFDLVHFTIENQLELIDCRTRHVGPGISGPDDLQWNAFGDGSAAGCPNALPVGKVDTVKVKIAPGTPPGDYTLAWHDAGFIAARGGSPACTSIGLGVGGVLRVLP